MKEIDEKRLLPKKNQEIFTSGKVRGVNFWVGDKLVLGQIGREIALSPCPWSCQTWGKKESIAWDLF